MLSRDIGAVTGKVGGDPEVKQLAVATDGLDRATGEGFLAESAFFVGLRLLENVGMAAVVITLEVCWRGLAAEVAVDALIVHVVGTFSVMGEFVCSVSHWVRPV